MRPGVLKTAMVKDHIHDNFQTLGMGLITKPLIIGIGTKTGVYLIIIGGSITMISRKTVLLVRRVIL